MYYVASDSFVPIIAHIIGMSHSEPHTLSSMSLSGISLCNSNICTMYKQQKLALRMCNKCNA